MEILNYILLIIIPVLVTIGMFKLHKAYHRHLDKKWEANQNIPFPNGYSPEHKLHTINGIGFRFTGHFRDAMIEGIPTYVTYYVFSFIIDIPLEAFRVHEVAPDRYHVIGSENKDFQEILCMAAHYLAILCCIAAVFCVIFGIIGTIGSINNLLG